MSEPFTWDVWGQIGKLLESKFNLTVPPEASYKIWTTPEACTATWTATWYGADTSGDPAVAVFEDMTGLTPFVLYETPKDVISWAYGRTLAFTSSAGPLCCSRFWVYSETHIDDNPDTNFDECAGLLSWRVLLDEFPEVMDGSPGDPPTKTLTTEFCTATYTLVEGSGGFDYILDNITLRLPGYFAWTSAYCTLLMEVFCAGSPYIYTLEGDNGTYTKDGYRMFSGSIAALLHHKYHEYTYNIFNRSEDLFLSYQKNTYRFYLSSLLESWGLSSPITTPYSTEPTSNHWMIGNSYYYIGSWSGSILTTDISMCGNNPKARVDTYELSFFYWGNETPSVYTTTDWGGLVSGDFLSLLTFAKVY